MKIKDKADSMLFVSLKSRNKILMEKKGYWLRRDKAQQGIQAAHRILVSFLRRLCRKKDTSTYLFLVVVWYPKRKKK